jgi:hypothetical protein
VLDLVRILCATRVGLPQLARRLRQENVEARSGRTGFGPFGPDSLSVKCLGHGGDAVVEAPAVIVIVGCIRSAFSEARERLYVARRMFSSYQRCGYDRAHRCRRADFVAWTETQLGQFCWRWARDARDREVRELLEAALRKLHKGYPTMSPWWSSLVGVIVGFILVRVYDWLAAQTQNRGHWRALRELQLCRERARTYEIDVTAVIVLTLAPMQAWAECAWVRGET